MALTFDDYSKKIISEKALICHIEPVQRLAVFSLVSGAIYKKSVDFYTINASQNGTDLTEASSSSLNAGEFYYDPLTSELYVRMSDNSNPNVNTIIATYRLFYSNGSYNLPYDLTSGTVVNYDSYLDGNSAIAATLDDEQQGIALESTTTVSFQNNDGHFDDFYDVLFFENKPIKLYAWSEQLPLSEKKLIFDGLIQDKGFSTNKVTFKCKDKIYQLRQPVNLDLFSSSDGQLSDNDLGKPKRRLYGQFKQLETTGVSKILDGFILTGTLSGSVTSTTVTGSGTSFLSEVSAGDRITIQSAIEEFEIDVESVDSDTSLTISNEAENNFTNETAINLPIRPYRLKNRTWHIADHKLRAPSTTVSTTNALNRITVADTSDFFENDLITVDGEQATIKRVETANNVIVLKANLQTLATGGEAVVKLPVSKVYANSTELIFNRDWSVTNTTEAKLVIDNLAEFNTARVTTSEGSLTFTNGSRTVTATGVDLKNEFQTRDWIQGPDVSHTTWYEVLGVNEASLTIRVAYAGANTSGTPNKKNVELIGDDTLITVNCLGYENGSGTWLKTASQAVKDLIESDAGLTSVNTSSFTEAESTAPQVLSLAIPENLRERTPTIRDTINRINQSVFGSLYNNTDFELSYSVLDSEKPTTLEEIRDDDLIKSPTIISKNDAVSKVVANYSHFIDRFTGESTSEIYEFTNDFVNTYIGNTQEKIIDLYLFNAQDAETIAQRYALYNSLSQSIVKVDSKLKFFLSSLNDKVLLNLDRLYKRFGNQDRRKIGIISKIIKDSGNVSLEISDLGNVFNRVMSIAPDTANEFTSASDDEKIKDGYIVDDDTELPDSSSDKELLSQIIG